MVVRVGGSFLEHHVVSSVSGSWSVLILYDDVAEDMVPVVATWKKEHVDDGTSRA